MFFAQEKPLGSLPTNLTMLTLPTLHPSIVSSGTLVLLLFSYLIVSSPNTWMTRVPPLYGLTNTSRAAATPSLPCTTWFATVRNISVHAVCMMK